MGERGPAPKRSDQRRRANKPATEVKRVEVEGRVERLPADPGWHELAVRWYEALAQSGQSRWYEPSDWATAYVLAESLSRDLKPHFVGMSKDGEPVLAETPLSGSAMSGYLRAMTALCVTEGDRRRAGVELVRPDPEEGGADVSDLNEERAERLRAV